MTVAVVVKVLPCIAYIFITAILLYFFMYEMRKSSCCLHIYELKEPGVKISENLSVTIAVDLMEVGNL